MAAAQMIEGDALQVLPQMPDGEVGAVITDPSYSSGGMFRGDRAARQTDQKYTLSPHRGKRPDFSGDNMDQRAWQSWCHRWLAEARRCTRAGGYLCCFTDWRQLPSLTDAVQHAGWIWRGVLTWDKTEAARSAHLGLFPHQCEFIVWGTNGPCFKKPSLAEGGEGKMPGCFRRAVSRANKFHQTGKPEDVMAWLVKCCPPGGLVLDPFAGSGSTGVACLQTGRRFLGVELSTDYVEIARRRLAAIEEAA